MIRRTFILAIASSSYAAVSFAADTVVTARPTIAKNCASCHMAETSAVRGLFDIVAFKTKTIQVKIDDTVELFQFDEDEIKVVNSAGKIGDGEFLKDNLVKKGHEIKVEYTEKNGVKTAVKLIEKPPVKVSAEMLIQTADIEKLVTQKPEQRNYFLFDSRPLPRYQEGFIPTAISLPFPAFDKLAEKLLPKDKSALIIFYCAGTTCNMSPGSADKAKKLGYTNIKVYKDGMPAWLGRHYGILSSQFLKEAWIGKDIPHVLLDVRPADEAAKGFIKGAIAFPREQAGQLIKELTIKKNAPVMVYDQNGGESASAVASALVKSGFKKVVVLAGGFDAWQTAGYDVASGKLTANATYTPKPRPGEINLEEFKKYAVELPDNVMIIDVRTLKEGKAGMLKTAKLIPADEIKDRLAEIPKDKLTILHCNTGTIAEVVYNSLKELGYSNIRFANAKIDFEKDGNYKITAE
jgi:rhodanese-related sulfurtransferase